jgi:hypothetical protein
MRVIAPGRTGRLPAAVACVASAMLLFELVVTRIFSVLFFYHFSFFAISLVMSGLVLGGILAARWNVPAENADAFSTRLARLAWMFSVAMLVAVAAIKFLPDLLAYQRPSLPLVTLYAAVLLPGLIAAGAFLAAAFARARSGIGGLYACDLLAAAAACLAAIVVMRVLPGPAAFLAPAMLAAFGGLALGLGRDRAVSLALAAVCVILAAGTLLTEGRLLRMETGPEPPILERWNEHSRVLVYPASAGDNRIVIDRSAATRLKHAPAESDGAPLREQPWWREGAQYTAYALGRPVRDVAVIGVGGGRDLFPALAHGAASVDGYELNGILVDLLEEDFRDFTALTTRPEVSLINDEARVGITHSGKRYDLIQASLIDTWAATASGGFVLSENGLYTREAWGTFLGRLSDTGVLTMSRWYIPDAPAEMQRLVALAAASLSDAGISDARPHVIVTTSRSRSGGAGAFTEQEASVATILVSKRPFSPEELARIRSLSAEHDLEVLLAPDAPARDPVISRLLNSETRAQTVAESAYDISPPTDLNPYFFLQLRPWEALSFFGKPFGTVTQITFNGVRVLVLLAGCALALTLAVVTLAMVGLPGSAAETADRKVYRRMTVYFLGIGLGYILVQLAMHQRLIIVIGHPTLALSIVLFTMLLGTGLGSAMSSRLFPSGSIARAGSAIIVTLIFLAFALVGLRFLEQVGPATVRLGLIAALVGGIGVVLGFAFPLGVRVVAPTGEWAVQKMWAINGAASIAGTVLAALAGITLGSRWVLIAGIAAYALAVAAGVSAQRVNERAMEPSISEPVGATSPGTAR